MPSHRALSFPSRYSCRHSVCVHCRSSSLSDTLSRSIICCFVCPSVSSVSIPSAAYRLSGEYTAFPSPVKTAAAVSSLNCRSVSVSTRSSVFRVHAGVPASATAYFPIPEPPQPASISAASTPHMIARAFFITCPPLFPIFLRYLVLFSYLCDENARANVPVFRSSQKIFTLRLYFHARKR